MTSAHLFLQYQPTSKKMMGLKEPPHVAGFKCGKPSPWEKKKERKKRKETALASRADSDSMLSKLDKQDIKGSQLLNVAKTR